MLWRNLLLRGSSQHQLQPASCLALLRPAQTYKPNHLLSHPKLPHHILTICPLHPQSQKNPRASSKKDKKQRKKDAEAAAQHNVADQRQDGEAAASAADEPPLAPVGMQPAQVLSQHFLPFL